MSARGRFHIFHTFQKPQATRQPGRSPVAAPRSTRHVVSELIVPDGAESFVTDCSCSNCVAARLEFPHVMCSVAFSMLVVTAITSSSLAGPGAVEALQLIDLKGPLADRDSLECLTWSRKMAQSCHKPRAGDLFVPERRRRQCSRRPTRSQK